MSSNKEVNIFVNANPQKVNKEKISYIEVVLLAFKEADPNTTEYLVEYYHNGSSSKVLGQGKDVNVHEGMNFNVTLNTSS